MFYYRDSYSIQRKHFYSLWLLIEIQRPARNRIPVLFTVIDLLRNIYTDHHSPGVLKTFAHLRIYARLINSNGLPIKQFVSKTPSIPAIINLINIPNSPQFVSDRDPGHQHDNGRNEISSPLTLCRSAGDPRLTYAPSSRLLVSLPPNISPSLCPQPEWQTANIQQLLRDAVSDGRISSFGEVYYCRRRRPSLAQEKPAHSSVTRSLYSIPLICTKIKLCKHSIPNK